MNLVIEKANSINSSVFNKPLYILFYICVCILVLYISMLTYFKLKYRFWSTQPVFHIYDVHHYFADNRILYENGFSRHTTLKKKVSSFLNFYAIQVMPMKYDSLEQIQKYESTFVSNSSKDNDETSVIEYYSMKHIQQLYNLVSSHYLKTKDNNYSPTLESIQSYFNGHETNCYIGYYMNNEPLFELGRMIQNTKPISVITSRPLTYIYIDNISNTTAHTYSTHIETIHYVDFLTTHTKYRKKNITPKLICSFAFQVETNENKPSVFLFKLEDSRIPSVVPFVSTVTYVFDVEDILQQSKKYIEYTNIHIEDTHSESCFNHHVSLLHPDAFQHFIHSMNTMNIKNYIHSNYMNIKDLVSKKVIMVYCLHETLNKNSPIIGLLFIKNNYHYYMEKTNKKYIFECVGSVFEDRIQKNKLFQQKTLYFIHNSLMNLKQTQKVGYITFENCSSNEKCIEYLQNLHIECLHTYSNSYYFYNYIKHTLYSKDVFFLM